MEPDPDIIADTKSYVSTQFFFYMLPNYLAIATFIYRYYTIMQHPPKRRTPQLPGQFIVTCFEDVIDQDTYEQQDLGIVPASYCIKSKLSLINSYVYLLMFIMGIFGDPDLYYASQHRTYSLVYILGVLSWQMSAFILRRQYQRDMAQSLWTHRFFWIFCGTFSVSKMFEDYLKPLNFFINSTMIITNLILALYGLYRPQDKGDAFLQIDTEIPSFAKVVFEKIEFHPTVRKLFRIQDEPPQTITLPNDSTDLTNNQLQQIQLTITTSSPQEQLQLLNKLPKRNIFVDRKTRAKLINDNVKYFFVIITQLNTERFEAERKYSEFEELDYSLSILFSVQNFPKLKLPRLRKQDFNRLGEHDNARRAEILQQWLQQLLQNPIFVNESVLNFLNVNEFNSAAFITYYNVSYKNFCSKAFLYSSVRQKNKIQTRQQRVSILRVVEQLVDNNGKIFLKQVKDHEFIVIPQHDDLKLGLLTFQITCKIPNKTPLKWQIKKQQQQFQTLNYNIQQQLKKIVPYYYQCMAKIPQTKGRNDKFEAKRLQAYGEYLRKVLNNNQYSSFALFKFINFDFIKSQVVGDNKVIQDYQNINALDYQKIQKSWTATGGLPCEVIRIQVQDQQQSNQIVYKFTLSHHNNNKILKTDKQIIVLRNHLIKIYKNLATIPELFDFERKILETELDKVKGKMDQFFSGVFSLPQINDNPTFQKFVTSNIIE